jgi:hypothetical protein
LDLEVAKLALKVMAKVTSTLKHDLNWFDSIHHFQKQMIILGSFISDTYFTSIRTIASISIAIVTATIVIFNVALSSKHFVILLGFVCKFHVIDLVFGTLRTL